MDGFWKWYLGVLKQVVLFKWVSSEDGEYFMGFAVVGVGIGFSIGSSLWFLLLILAGITMAAHGFWRKLRKGE